MGFFKNKLKVFDAFGIPVHMCAAGDEFEPVDTTTTDTEFTKKQIQKYVKSLTLRIAANEVVSATLEVYV